MHESPRGAGAGLRAFSRPRWYRLYFLLAGFDLFTVSLSLVLSHQVSQTYARSVELNRVWSQRLADYSQLGQLAAAVNAPGNDVFASLDVATESDRMRAAEADFARRFVALREDVQRHAGLRHAEHLLEDFDAVDSAMNQMTEEAERIFAYLASGQPEQAGQRMATMDRKYGVVNTALAQLRNHVATIQQDNFAEQHAAAGTIKRFEYLIALFVVVMVGAASLYGHKMTLRVEEDARERERTVEELRDAEARTRSILDTATDGIVTFDRRGLVESANPAAGRIFGTHAEALVGTLVSALIPRLSWEEHAGMQEATAGADGPACGRLTELEAQRRDGTTFPAELAVSALTLGERRMYTAVIRDLSERRRAEEALREAEHRALQADKLRALGQLASGVAHDLNQSLLLVAAYAELAEKTLELPTQDLGPVREALRTVTRAAMDGGQTVKRMLTFARGRAEGERERVDLGALLGEVAQLTAPQWRDAAQAEGRPIDLEVEAAKETVCLGWPAGLREALTNLVLNAVDALPQGGRIRLTALRSGAQTVVEVADSGVGMSPEVRARLFEPFFTTKGERGTGLGLSQVFGIVQRHGGRIHVESAPGRGTAIQLLLPAAPAPVAALQAAAQAQTEARPLRVLAVDDEPAITNMMSRFLRAAGHVVVKASSGEEALLRLAAEPFDVVVSDVGMGAGMNGWELADRVRRDWPGMRFVLSTGWGHGISLEEARARGVEAILAKPYQSADLQRVVAAPPPATRPARSPVPSLAT